MSRLLERSSPSAGGFRQLLRAAAMISWAAAAPVVLHVAFRLVIEAGDDVFRIVGSSALLFCLLGIFVGWGLMKSRHTRAELSWLLDEGAA